MLSSHTLISYPLLSRMGLVSRPIVTIIVGATIITDILALVSMEFIANFSETGFEFEPVLHLILNFSLFLLFVLFLIPKIAGYFLNRFEGELGVQYVFVLAMLFLSSGVAWLLGLEPILGAFFSGLVFNRRILNSSPLFRRIEFVGNHLFIPFFLISIGIRANFRVFVDEPLLIGILLLFTIVALGSKYLAAVLSRYVFKLSWPEGNLLFGLSASRAASAIAIILVGFNLGILEETVLNITVMLILFTCISSSYITQRAGKKLLVTEDKQVLEDLRFQQKILIPLANPSNMKHLIEFGLFLKKDTDTVPLYPLTVFTNGKNVEKRISEKQDAILKIIRSLHTEETFEVTSRIDNNVTNGITRAAEELVATAIVMGWNKPGIPANILFGTVLKNLLEKTRKMLIVLKTPSSLKEVKKIYLICPENAQYEKGFYLWLTTIHTLIRKLQIKVEIVSESPGTTEAIRKINVSKRVTSYFSYSATNSMKKFSAEYTPLPGDMIIFVHARREAISYSRLFDHVINRSISNNQLNNVLIIYPEQ